MKATETKCYLKLNEKQLTGFEKYKVIIMTSNIYLKVRTICPFSAATETLYKSLDTSILSKHVMHPFWDWCVQFFPLWIAPNILTFTGFLLTVFNFLLFSYYDFGFHAMTRDNVTNDNIPSWVWALSAVNLFVAYTLDGIDGKQARRTGTSGPLGELFDHGLDSYSALFIPACLYSVFGRTEVSPLRFYFLLWNTFINFYLTHWEKYNTGIMFLPWGYDFMMIGLCLLLSVSWIAGPSVWHFSLPGGLTPGLMLEITLYVSAILSSQTIIMWNIYKSYRDRTGKLRTFNEAMRPLLPVFIFFILSTIWVLYSPHDVVNSYPRLFYLLTGTIFSNINCRLIVAQMSDTRCEAFNSLLYPYTAAVLLVVLLKPPAMLELVVLLSLCFKATFSHIRYGSYVVQDMCNHFNIQCFQIKPKLK